MTGVIALLATSACSIDSIPFRCDRDEQCVKGDAHGLCEAKGYCSFSDSNCEESKRRYGDAAPAEIAGKCVPKCVTKVSAGFEHTCAIRGDGRVACWGNATNGQLGNGATAAENYASPIDVDSLVSPASDLSAGSYHTCVVRSPEGSIWCWGSNVGFQLANPEPLVTGPIEIPRPTPDLAAVEVAAGGAHTCARGGWGVACWGVNKEGQLGNGSPGEPGGPVAVTGLGSLVLAIEGIRSGGQHSCVELHSPLSMKCWGSNQYGQVNPTAPREPQPTPIDVKLPGVSALSLGAVHSCAVSNGQVRCWGAGGGVGNAFDFFAIDLEASPTVLAAGGAFTCALLENGHVQCWGNNDNGQLGPTATVGAKGSGPTLVPFANRIEQLACGGTHCCAVDEKDRLACWGGNGQGQLGNGETDEPSHPEPDSTVWKSLCE